MCPLRHLRRVSLPGARQVRCGYQLRSAIMHLPNVTLMTNSRVTRLLTNSTGTAVRRSKSSTQDLTAPPKTVTPRPMGGLLRRLCRRHQLRGDSTRVCERQVSHRARQPLRPGRPELHVPPGGCLVGAWPGGQRGQLHQDLGHKRFLLQGFRSCLSFSPGAGAAGRQLPLRDDEGRCPSTHARLCAGDDEAARGALVAYDGRSARP